MSLTKKLLPALVAVATAFGPILAHAAEQAPIEASLNADQSGPFISRFIYGQFSEHLGRGIYDGVWVGPQSKIPNVRGIRTDVVTALKDIKVPVIRWPGGCFADEYHWRDGIGAQASRPSRRNNWWGGTPETNEFGTHEFFDFIGQVGSEAYISMNVGSSSPTEMREWIEYMTSPDADTLANERRANGRKDPWKVAFFGIGNESWGCGGEMTAQYYSDEYRRFKSFFHNRPVAITQTGTPENMRIASGASDFNVEWTETLMKNAGRHMDGISLHYYTLPTGKWDKKGAATGFGREDWLQTMYQTLKMDDILYKHEAVMDKYDPNNRVPLFVDEWGTWYDVEKGTNPGHLYQLNTLRDAVVAAANFNIFHKHAKRVKMTAIAQTINVLQAMILTKDDKIVLTPTYYAFKMYTPFMDATSIPLEVTAPSLKAGDKTFPAFNLSAAKGKDGKTYIGIAGLDPENSYTINLNLKGLKAKSVTGEVLTADKMDALNPMGGQEVVHPVSFKGAKLNGNSLTIKIPAKSVVVLSLQ